MKEQKRAEVVLGNVMIDCANAEQMRRFYGELLGWEQCELYGCPAVRSSSGIVFLSAAGSIGRCGFCCGVCPSFTSGECGGCAAHQSGDCFTRDCTEKRGIAFCTLCIDFPCVELLDREKATVLDKAWLRWKRQG